jgi:hypothetical protein
MNQAGAAQAAGGSDPALAVTGPGAHRVRRKFTLISAPAGFGKTTLIIEHVDQAGLIAVINHVK